VSTYGLYGQVRETVESTAAGELRRTTITYDPERTQVKSWRYEETANVRRLGRHGASPLSAVQSGNGATDHAYAVMAGRNGHEVLAMAEVNERNPDYDRLAMLPITSTEQLSALANVTRFRILGLLHDRAASTQQIANQLGILKGSVSYHLKVLTRAGLVKLVNTRKVRGVTERFYGRTARGFDFTSAAAPVGARGFELRVVADDMEYATPRAADLVVVRRVRLSDDAVSALARELDALLDAVIDRADPSEPIRAVAVALYTPESG